MNKEIGSDIELQAHIGRVHIKIQIFEFLIHGLVSHFKPEILQKTKLKGLTPKMFLSSTEADKKKRKHTLGQILEVIKGEAQFAYWAELDSYLQMRNDFVHHFWRDFISKNFDRDKSIKFLSALEHGSEDWTRVFRGLLSLMAKAVLSRQSPQDQITYQQDQRYQSIKLNESYEQFFFEKLSMR
jgi:hypothetical protein